MPSEGTNAHMSALHLWVQADGSPEHTTACSPWVGGEEKQQKRVRAMLGTAGGTRKGEGGFWQVIVLEKCWCSGQAGQKGKDQSEFGGCSLEQMALSSDGGAWPEWKWLCPSGANFTCSLAWLTSSRSG